MFFDRNHLTSFELHTGRIFYVGEGIAVRLFVFLACRFTTQDVARKTATKSKTKPSRKGRVSRFGCGLPRYTTIRRFLVFCARFYSLLFSLRLRASAVINSLCGVWERRINRRGAETQREEKDSLTSHFSLVAARLR